MVRLSNANADFLNNERNEFVACGTRTIVLGFVLSSAPSHSRPFNKT